MVRIRTKQDADNILRYFYGKISKERYLQAYNDTVALSGNKFTAEEIYMTVMNSILNCAICEVKTEKLKTYIQAQFRKHYTV